MTALRYATPGEVFAALEDGGTISVEEFPQGDIELGARAAWRREDMSTDAAIVLAVAHDGVGGSPIDAVWFHPDQTNRLDVLRRARAALEAAEAALVACGWVDDAHLADKGA